MIKNIIIVYMDTLLKWMYFGGVILVIVIIAIIWWVVSKKEIDGPKVRWLSSNKVYHPNKSRKDTIEEYRIEYLTEDTGEALAKNIDIIVKWKNVSGFEAADVKALKFSHDLEKDDTIVPVASDKILRDTNHITDETINTYTLKGTDFNDESIIGKHIITMYYTVDNDNWVKINTFEIDITADDLKYTVDLDTIETVTYLPDVLKVEGGLEISIGENFKIQDINGNELIIVKIEDVDENIKILDQNNNYIHIINDGWDISENENENITYKLFKYLDTDLYFLIETVKNVQVELKINTQNDLSGDSVANALGVRVEDVVKINNNGTHNKYATVDINSENEAVQLVKERNNKPAYTINGTKFKLKKMNTTTTEKYITSAIDGGSVKWGKLPETDVFTTQQNFDSALFKITPVQS